ncbi:phenazine biosynthesis protein PhzD [Pseudomonas aeruginosa PA38182]|nr:phenazine biosynthesis protein PhzD [Pseudomonas aeruginosa PA38182]
MANAARLRRWCVEQGVQIAYTAQPGSMTEEQRGLLKDFWGPGMRASPADREVVEELAPGPDDWLLTKWRYSAFFHSAGRHWRSRMFSPAYGVVEDAATGSAAGPLAIHLARHRQIPYGQQIEILQASRSAGRRACTPARGRGERVSAVEVSGNVT